MEYWIFRKNFPNKVFKNCGVFLTNSSMFLNFHIKTYYLANTHTHTQLTDSIYSKTKGEVIAMDAKLQVDRIFEKR